VSEPADQSTPPLRTWRPMALWSVGILLALGLAWFVGAVAVPVWQTQKVVQACLEHRSTYDECMQQNAVGIQQLGGPAKAASKLYLYARLPWISWQHGSVATSLLQYCGKDSVPALCGLLKHRHREVRERAARVLWETGDARATEPLIMALRDESWQVREMVVGALGFVRDQRATVPLIGMLGDKDTCVRRNVAISLGWIGNPAAVEPLQAALGDRYHDVRTAVAEALGRIGPEAKATLPALQKLAASDPEGDVRAAAASALNKIRGEEPPK